MCPILDDCRTIIESYGQEGVIDPFEKIYEVRAPFTYTCRLFLLLEICIAYVSDYCSYHLVFRTV